MSGTIHVISDTHDRHKNIINLCNRPFRDKDGNPDIVLMRQTMLENINKKVRPGDMLIHVGDVALGDPYDFLDQINCQVAVVLGNHDSERMFERYETKNKSHNIVNVTHYLELDCFDVPIIFFHYPILSWKKAYRGAIHFHGHCHGNLPNGSVHLGNNSQRCDVGVDDWNFTCMAIEELREYLKTQTPWEPIDHHGGNTND